MVAQNHFTFAPLEVGIPTVVACEQALGGRGAAGSIGDRTKEIMEGSEAWDWINHLLTKLNMLLSQQNTSE